MQLIENSDFISIHLPLADETHHLINREKLRKMKKSAVLINTARGPIIDEQMLVVALRENWIAAAGLDVYQDEPRMAEGLAELENVILAPHVGSATVKTRDDMARIAATNLLAVLQGKRPPHPVNPEVFDQEK